MSNQQNALAECGTSSHSGLPEWWDTLRSQHPQSKPVHSIANLVPSIAPEQFWALVEDIKQSGLRQPILLLNGEIVDGKSRELACFVGGVEPRYEEWDKKGSLGSLVLSLNLHRRHLSESQRAILAAELVPVIQHKLAAPISSASEFAVKSNGANLRGSRKAAIKHAAKMVSVSEGSVVAGLRVMERGSAEQVSAVKQGKKRVSVADAELNAPLMPATGPEEENFSINAPSLMLEPERAIPLDLPQIIVSICAKEKRIPHFNPDTHVEIESSEEGFRWTDEDRRATLQQAWYARKMLNFRRLKLVGAVREVEKNLREVNAYIEHIKNSEHPVSIALLKEQFGVQPAEMNNGSAANNEINSEGKDTGA